MGGRGNERNRDWAHLRRPGNADKSVLRPATWSPSWERRPLDWRVVSKGVESKRSRAKVSGVDAVGPQSVHPQSPVLGCSQLNPHGSSSVATAKREWRAK